MFYHIRNSFVLPRRRCRGEILSFVMSERKRERKRERDRVRETEREEKRERVREERKIDPQRER